MKTIGFINEIEPEMRWHNDELLIFLYPFWMEDFMKALQEDGADFEDGGIMVHMKDGYFVVDVAEILKYMGEDPELILSKKDKEVNT